MITINVDKAKVVAHNARRAARTFEFEPLDVKATIPSEAVAVEAARQEIRDRYAAMQVAIENATTPEEIKAAMPDMQAILGN